MSPRSRPSRRSGPVAVLTLLVLAVLLGGCATVPTPLPSALLGARAQALPPYEVITSSTPTTVPPSCDPRAASLRPVPGAAPIDQPALRPGTGRLPLIRSSHRLRIGVDQNTALFGFKASDGSLQGVDVDIAHEVARRVLGDANAIDFHFVGNDGREQAVLQRDGIPADEVDMVVRTMTVNCDRLQRVAFSSVYFEAVQRILVVRSAPGEVPSIQGPEDLAGRRTCATRGSDSLEKVLALPGPHTVLAVSQWNDCLVLLREGAVDAISTDHTILDGMAASDPSTEIVGPAVGEEPYAIAMNPADTDLVRAVNAALADIRADGTWTAIYQRWLGFLGPVPPPPQARYRD